VLCSVTPHIEKLAQTSEAIRKQFYPTPQEESDENKTFAPDPLMEEAHMVVRGLVHKYGKRGLMLLTLTCAAYCRFCTRRRCVGEVSNGDLTRADIDRIQSYLIEHNDINEVIISGGDPLTQPAMTLYAFDMLAALETIKVIRIHTRVPVVDPQAFPEALLEKMQSIDKPIYMIVHFEHPDEITPMTIDILRRIRKAGVPIFSQSIFLKGVNDDVDVLERLFSRLIEIGVKPYYLYRCDEVRGAEHFIVELERERAIVTELRRRLSGLAFPLYIVDVPHGCGKIPVPLEFWDCDVAHYRDFKGEEHTIAE
jgi:lysine 2,3-aminomutase